jgi:hypothetical protein
VLSLFFAGNFFSIPVDKALVEDLYVNDKLNNFLDNANSFILTAVKGGQKVKLSNQVSS